MIQAELKTLLNRLHEAEASYASYNAAYSFLKKKTPEELNLPSLRFIFLRNYTTEGLNPVIAGEMARVGIALQIQEGEYDQIQQEILNSSSLLYQSNPEVIALGLWLETLAPQLVNRLQSFNAIDLAQEVNRVLIVIEGYLQGIRRACSVPLLINNFPVLERSHELTSVLHELNQGIEKMAKRFSDVYVIDLKNQFALLGSDHALDHRYWHMAKAPYTQSALIAVGKEYARFLKKFSGKIKKCLVLDCDQTLWGGIIGEDGLTGIKLGKEFPGSPYLSFQQEILNLHDRGVLIALCSKNNEADVLEVLRSHPEMLIRENHIAAHQINWDDKATNLKRIAQELNIGLDSLVFIDDSSFECELVRTQLPEVEVIQLPQMTSSFRRVLNHAGLFDTLSFSAEDLKRTQMIQSQAIRKKREASAESMDDFLMSLQLEAKVSVPTELEIARVAQLTQKTNQFNLTTKRYTEAQIRDRMNSACHQVFCIRLKDNVDDLGLIGVAILEYQDEHVEIDTFLLSCRALGRGAEDALMYKIVTEAKKRIPHGKMSGKYIKTAKNGQVEDFYSRFNVAENSPLNSINVEMPKWLRVNL